MFCLPALQLPFPQPIPGTIAAATVSGDYEPLSRRVAFSAKLLPPTINRCNSKLRCVRTDSDGHSCFIAMNVVNTIRHRLAFGLVRKVMGINRAGFPLGFVGLARIFLVSQRFFLLRVHRNGRFTTPLLGQHAGVDMLKLRIAIRMLLALSLPCGWPEDCNPKLSPRQL